MALELSFQRNFVQVSVHLQASVALRRLQQLRALRVGEQAAHRVAGC
jgi:hypothetical protein